ncbi:MAG: hypothetical protein H0V17_00575 [Deltaproteobacteria bacterium]|nr:hypothetical protein [Deltaproteobacteria bacterium]
MTLEHEARAQQHVASAASSSAPTPKARAGFARGHIEREGIEAELARPRLVVLEPTANLREQVDAQAREQHS